MLAIALLSANYQRRTMLVAMIGAIVVGSAFSRTDAVSARAAWSACYGRSVQIRLVGGRDPPDAACLHHMINNSVGGRHSLPTATSDVYRQRYRPLHK